MITAACVLITFLRSRSGHGLLDLLLGEKNKPFCVCKPPNMVLMDTIFHNYALHLPACSYTVIIRYSQQLCELGHFTKEETEVQGG